MSRMHQQLLTIVTICARWSRCLILNVFVSPTSAIVRINGSHINATTLIVKRCEQAKTVKHLHELNIAVVTCTVCHSVHDSTRLLFDLDTSPQAQHDHFLYRCHCDWQCTQLTAVALLPKRRVVVLVDACCTLTNYNKTNRLWVFWAKCLHTCTCIAYRVALQKWQSRHTKNPSC